MNEMVRTDRSVLLIEDSDTQALLVEETLADAGMSVHRVPTAEAGLEYLQANRPSLAVVDYHLPGMQGNEFCRAIRDNRATETIPLLILTDDTQADAEKYVLDCGADDYVAKSRDSDILLARIDLLLRRAQKRSSAMDEVSFYKAQRVLLVDDSPTYLAFLEDELGRDGYRLFLADSGPAAIEVARQNHIDCAVIDLVMPGMDGIALCGELVKMRKPGRSLPVLIVTAQGSKERMMESLEVGADDYVEKSGDPTVLKARLRALLRRKMLQDEHQRIQDEIRDKELELIRERAHGEAHMRAILDNAADGIITIGTNGLIRTFNKAAERIFGRSAEEAIGENVSVFMPDDGAAQHDNVLLRSLDDPREGRIIGRGPQEMTARRSDGTLFPAEFSVGEFATEDERLFIGVIRDVTERHRTEEALRAADEQIHLLLDSVGEGVYGLDMVGRTTFVNRSALQMLGFAEDELIGKSAHAVLRHCRDGADKAAPAGEAPDMATIRTGEAREAVEETLCRKDGDVLPVLLSSRPVVKDGDLVGAVVSFQDISHNKDLEARLRQSQKMEAIGRLTGGVAHDFNNLLTVIMGNLQLLGRALGDDGAAVARIDKIMAAAKSGADLTRRLLSFSRQQVLETTVVDINELVASLEDMLRRTMGENITIATVPNARPSLGRTDRNQLEHALLNLCVNARDAMNGGGRLTIETRSVHLDETYAASHNEVRPGCYIEICVSDTGTGIAPEILDKIFEPFFTTKPKGEGTGLGLATIFGFMKQSGGHVTVYSELGHGTTFKLYVAGAESTDDTGEAATDEAEHVAAGGHATILVVEDEAGVRDIAVSMLAEAGYSIVEAQNGPAGLAAFAEHPEIDLVFSDVIMPGGMTGPQMVELIRQQRPDIPVLFASGYAEQALKDRESLIPHSKFIAKPYDVAELARRVSSLLEARR